MEHFFYGVVVSLLTYEFIWCSPLCQHENEILKEKNYERVSPPYPNSPGVQNMNSTKNMSDIGCICALFTSQLPAEDDVPILSKTFHNVSCHDHESGEDVCIKVCISFALRHYKEKDDIICSYARNATDMNGYMQSKICGKRRQWNFTGLSTSKPICCQEGKTVSCNDQSVGKKTT